MTLKRKNLIANFEAHSVVLVASWALAGAALAQTMPAPARDDKTPSALFTQADQNADGQLSRAEAATVPGLEAAFDKLDADRDGSLSPEEFAKGTLG